MKVHDVLLEVARHQLTEEEAESVLDKILDSDEAKNAEALLALSRAEWTAHCQGATFTDLADWRYHGWPIQCTECGQEISIDKFGWKIIDVADVSKLRHIRCP